MSGRRHVGSTYRLQLNGIGFAGATALVPFLHGLGIETCYVSPVTRARTGSTHGYDVVDPTRLDPSLGSEQAFETMLAALADHDMGLLIDIVPNHMAASTENPFFADVLRHGRRSEFAPYFDIAWDEQDGKILLPVLGKPLPEVLEAGEIQLIPDNGIGGSDRPFIAYFEQRFPVAPDTVHADLAELLDAQHYRLADWRVANHEVNYRRFFDINELIGVRQEDPQVFTETHRLIEALTLDPRVVGLRVDHVDGLADPSGYLEMLRVATGGADVQPVILIEKILGRDEGLPEWPVEGTTGYEFADLVVGLFVAEHGAADLAAATAAATSDQRSFAARAFDDKRRVIETLFPHQLDQVSAHAIRALSADGGTPVTPATARTAIGELTTALEVYRTYRRPEAAIRPDDLVRIRRAADDARATLEADSAVALDRFVGLLGGDAEPRGEAWQAIGAWQQLTGPVTAKGVEDTASYNSGHLIATADVGADPDHPAVSAPEFHAVMTLRQRERPLAMSSTSTHDSKRSHDVRCRLAVLSELAGDWEKSVTLLDDLSSQRGAKQPDAADRRYVYETLVGSWPLSEPIGEEFVDRIRAHLSKAAREAKRHSNWVAPNLEYEEALGDLAQRVIAGEDTQCRRIVENVVSAIERAGAANSLASVVLKATAPGVPDIYQGDDRWFFALVDPDNRGELDVAAHADGLAHLPPLAAGDCGEQVEALMSGWRSGAVKQLVVRNALDARRRAPDLFKAGGYQPLEVFGRHRDHVLTYARSHADGYAVAIVPRFAYSLAGPGRFPLGAEDWADTEVALPAHCPPDVTDALTGRRLVATNGRMRLAAALSVLPVAILRG
jgi:(1->4)-alpha-D-glucan 1-alpha-D-glucosylmutase